MPVSIQPTFQFGIVPDRVAFSGDHLSGALCLDLFADALTVITLVRHNHLGRWQMADGRWQHEFRSCRAVVDVASGDLESYRQAMGIDRQVDLARIAGVTFSDRFRLTTDRTGTVLMSLYIGSVDECPFKIGFLE